MSRQLALWSARWMDEAPLVRLSLHPRDAQYPRTVAHFQELMRRLLRKRRAMTKAAFAKAAMAHPSLWT
jgi:hypothetical protein